MSLQIHNLNVHEYVRSRNPKRKSPEDKFQDDLFDLGRLYAIKHELPAQGYSQQEADEIAIINEKIADLEFELKEEACRFYVEDSNSKPLIDLFMFNDADLESIMQCVIEEDYEHEEDL